MTSGKWQVKRHVPPVAQYTALVIGDAEHHEFRGCIDALASGISVVKAHDVPTALTYLARGDLAPALIVLLQRWPGQFSTAAVDRLHAMAPLARVWGLLGSWCEGEGRSGKPWPGAQRTYWHQWPARCGGQLARIVAGRQPSWALPVTSGDDERLLAAEPLVRRSGLIVVLAAQNETATALGDACRLRGYTTVTARPDQRMVTYGALAALWDATAAAAGDGPLVRRIRDWLPGAALVALVDFPRRHDCDRALACGVSAVVSKPFLLEDLFWQLDRLD